MNKIIDYFNTSKVWYSKYTNRFEFFYKYFTRIWLFIQITINMEIFTERICSFYWDWIERSCIFITNSSNCWILKVFHLVFLVLILVTSSLRFIQLFSLLSILHFHIVFMKAFNNLHFFLLSHLFSFNHVLLLNHLN